MWTFWLELKTLPSAEVLLGLCVQGLKPYTSFHGSLRIWNTPARWNLATYLCVHHENRCVTFALQLNSLKSRQLRRMRPLWTFGLTRRQHQTRRWRELDAEIPSQAPLLLLLCLFCWFYFFSRGCLLVFFWAECSKNGSDLNLKGVNSLTASCWPHKRGSRWRVKRIGHS